MPLRRSLVLAILLSLTACAKDSPVDPASVATSIVAIQGASQNGTVGVVVGTMPMFEARNSDGLALAGVTVSIAVTGGGGTLMGQPTTSAAGPTAIGTWTLGPTAGAQTVTVSKNGLTPVIFTTTAAPGAAVGIAIGAGNTQSALAGAAVANPVRAKVVDQFGNGRPGESISWNIAAGGGSLTGGTTTVADVSGLASAPAWTLGKNGGIQELRASSGAFEVVASATIQSAYQLELRWIGTVPTGATLNAFTRAVDRIRATVVGALTPIGMPVDFTNASQCDANLSQAIPNQVIQGVIIYASVVSIDGAGGLLGSAVACLVRDGSAKFRTALGTMRFDSADMAAMVSDGRIDAVILHEMLHVIGVGTIWTDNSLLLNGGTADSRFTGALARGACAGVNGGPITCAATVPVHSADGAGARDSHWRESIFLNELMTPFIGVGGTAPMSAMTIQSLADEGYVVNANTQDAYTVAAGLSAGIVAEGPAPADPRMLRLTEPGKPVFMIDRQGRLVRLRELK